MLARLNNRRDLLLLWVHTGYRHVGDKPTPHAEPHIGTRAASHSPSWGIHGASSMLALTKPCCNTHGSFLLLINTSQTRPRLHHDHPELRVQAQRHMLTSTVGFHHSGFLSKNCKHHKRHSTGHSNTHRASDLCGNNCTHKQALMQV